MAADPIRSAELEITSVHEITLLNLLELNGGSSRRFFFFGGGGGGLLGKGSHARVPTLKAKNFTDLAHRFFRWVEIHLKKCATCGQHPVSARFCDSEEKNAILSLFESMTLCPFISVVALCLNLDSKLK